MDERLPPGLILQHEDAAPAALFADWCDRRGIAFEVLRVWEEGLPASVAGLPWICSLGSDHSPGADGAPAWVEEEVAFLRGAIDSDVPVLGLCFGGQALAAAAGARTAPADPPEIGWLDIDTDDPGEIPAGPWLYFHYDQFALPPGAEEIARSPAGTAAFRLGRHLGLQFHPEATPAIVDGWCASEEERLNSLGISRPAVGLADRERTAASEEAAEILFDRWWASLGID